MVREEQELIPRAAAVQQSLQVILHRRRLCLCARNVIRVHQTLLLDVHLAVAAGAQQEPVVFGVVPQPLQLLLDRLHLPVRLGFLIQRYVHLLPSLGRELRQNIALEPAHHDEPRNDRVELVRVLAPLPSEPRPRTVPLRKLRELGEDVRPERLHLRVQLHRSAQRRGAREADGSPRGFEQRDHRLGPLRLGVLDEVRLVAHDNLEVPRRQFALHLPHERVRHDGERRGVDLMRLGARTNRRDETWSDVEPPPQRLVPRVPQRRGHQNQTRPLLSVAGDERERLHRLAQTHLIADEHPAAAR